MTTRSVSRALALVFLLLPAAPVAPRAAEGAPEEPYKVRVNLAFFTGPQRYSMNDINKGIAEINSDFSEVPELEAAGLKHEMVTYGGAPHAFTVFGSDRYREDADRKSWALFGRFLSDVLK